MIELTPDARRRFDEYLQRTRSALRGTRAVEAAEVEQNVIEHVELALAGVPAPVGAGPLSQVLEQLGPPERWLPDEELPIWRRVLGRLMNGPEDWRLTYLSFAFTCLMVITFAIGGVLLLPIAFLLSRAVVQLVQEKGESLGARRWLVLPPIWLAFLLFLGASLMAGIAAPMVFASEHGLSELGFRDPVNRLERLRMSLGLVAMGAGAWWVVLSGLFAWLLPAIRSLFAPVLTKVRRPHLLWMTGLGALAAAVGAILLWVV
jgi:hypothetical protein